jgi:cation diffusion facilitator family transporter
VTAARDEPAGGEASRRTVLVAGAANLGIAIAKAVAAVLTGSAALWAETLHSIADTANEVLLLVGLRRSRRPRDASHPLGYGQERYFWAFLAAIGIFLIGGLLSIGEGVRALLFPEPLESPWLGIGVIVIAMGFEGYSWSVARRQLRTDASRRSRSVAQHLVRTSDPSATTVYLEDSAALIGLALALLALVLRQVTGQDFWDPAASMAIGVVLAAVSYLLARRSKALLIDESVPADVLADVRAIFAPATWIADLSTLDAVYVGPAQILVTAQVVPTRALLAGPADTLLRHAAALRADLLRSPAIIEAAITLIPDTGTDAGAARATG